MLRRKLLLVLGSVVTLLLASGLAAILMLQDVLRDLDRVVSQAATATIATTELHVRLAHMQTQLHQIDQGHDLPRESMHNTLAHVLGHLQALGELDAVTSRTDAPFGEPAHSHSRLASHAAQLQELLRAGPTFDHRQALETLEYLRQALSDFETQAHAYTEIQQTRATTKFRWTALWLGLAFVIIINVSIMVFSRMSSMILKPVDRLVDASRRLGREEFSYRVELDRADEFGELAQAYNRLAEQLEANEQRKVETLHQVARTLSHELNNAISIVQSQLDLLARTPPGNGEHDRLPDLFRGRLREIHQAMARMSAIVADLTRVRRIVLTDYLSGVKMLDLQRSVQDEPVSENASVRSQIESSAS